MKRRTPGELKFLARLDNEYDAWLFKFVEVMNKGLKKWYDYLVGKYGLNLTKEIIEKEIMSITNTPEFISSKTALGIYFTHVDFIFVLVYCILLKFVPNDLTYVFSEFDELGFRYLIKQNLYHGSILSIVKNANFTLNELFPHLDMFEIMRKIYLRIYKVY